MIQSLTNYYFTYMYETKNLNLNKFEQLNKNWAPPWPTEYKLMKAKI